MCVYIAYTAYTRSLINRLWMREAVAQRNTCFFSHLAILYSEKRLTPGEAVRGPEGAADARGAAGAGTRRGPQP